MNLHLLLLAGLSTEVNSVTQRQGQLSGVQSDSVTLDCTFSTEDAGYDTYWYKQDSSWQTKYLFRRSAGSSALGDSVKSNQLEVSGSVGGSVTLTCSYTTSDTYVSLSWYRQYPNQAPQYILLRGAKGSTFSDTADFAQKRFSSQANDSATALNITALELADSAVYYCALQRAQ
ncbi:Ig lambda chain V-II region NEI [Chelonia mydas]|uniref:Ig lambda chain V-II region NEI n=1 Tax=Chelonia mydas TaxID=8469 RepID=M7BLZ3_CHEMY|nr:Ig lambda chain V-II region NEI [Chelonia mydas]